MNILYLCDEYPPCQHGGIGTATQLLSRTLVNMGHNVYVAGFYPYYRKAEKEATDNGVKIYRFFYGSKLILQFSKRNFFGKFINIDRQFTEYIQFVRKIVEEKQISIIEIPDFVEAFRYSGPRIIKFPDFGIPIVVKLHGSFTVLNAQNGGMKILDSVRLKEQYLLNSARAVVGVSNSIKQRVKSMFNYSQKIDVLYNGIVFNQVSKYDAKANSNAIVFAGSLVKSKGIFSLLSAWEQVIKAVPSARLILCGKSDVRSMGKIHSFMKSLSNNSVELKGFVPKEILPDIYASASCAVFPSYQESFSMAPMEAMAVGCPVIYTKRTSGPELITNGVDGLLVDPDNINEIANAILFILKNRTEAIALGVNGYLKIKNNFDISIVAKNHLAYYAGLL